MKYLAMIRVDETTGRTPSDRLQEEMGKLFQEWIRDGKLVRTAGLRPTGEGFRVRSRYGKIAAVDGPFTETKEVIGGYFVLEAADREEAMELTRQFLTAHADEWELECEVRPLDGQEFGPEN